jgi:hypothetical protein
MIRWNKKRSQELTSAINKFNKRLREVEKLDLDITLPKKQTYNELREDILTTKQFNQTLASLNRFNKSTATRGVKLDSDEVITAWEWNETIRRQGNAIEKIQKDLDEEMEQQTFKGLKNERIDKLEATLETLQNFQTKKGNALRYSLDRIRKIGNVDYKLKKAETFRENFMSALKEGAGNFANYKMFEKDLKKIKNPQDFYNYVKNSDTFMDIFVWYNDEGGAIVYGNFKNNEDAFNKALVEDFGYNIEF